MSTASTFLLRLSVPRVVALADRRLEREEFFGWLWQQYGERGLTGVHEGTVLSEQAAEQGFETESFTVDAAQAPRERDWIAAQGEASVEAYFASEDEARAAQRELRGLLGDRSAGGYDAGGVRLAGAVVGEIVEQKPQDWDAEWKKSFLNAYDGVALAPFWRILPAWVGADLASGKRRQASAVQPGERPLLINPGAGFGTGTHETTQLCLQAIGHFSLGRSRGAAAGSAGGQLLSGLRVLDFGSGSGILAIGAALLGAHVDAVEIDELAIDNARENARLNGVEDRIDFSRDFAGCPGGGQGPYPLVIANILRPVLVQFAPELVRRLAPAGAAGAAGGGGASGAVGTGGYLVLSGLVAADVPEIEVVFSRLLGGARPQVYERGEWRAVVWGL